MQNLNKENFWNNIEQVYPDAFKMFSEWIDKYKKEIGGFGFDSNEEPIKFHDLPFEFQNGILARFDIECHHGIISGNGKKTYQQISQNEPRRIGHLFADLQNQININTQ